MALPGCNNRLLVLLDLRCLLQTMGLATLRSLAFLTLFLTLLQCRVLPQPTPQQQVDRLRPDERILKAAELHRQNNKKWTLYAWNNTRLEDLTSNKSRETYRVLKTWLFSNEVSDSRGNLRNLQISALYLDYDDLWLGTWNGGISRLSLSSKERFVLQADTPALIPKVVYRIRKSGNALWFATHQGLRFYNYHSGGTIGSLQIPGVTNAVADFLENEQGLFIVSLSQGAWQRARNGSIYPLKNLAAARTIEASMTALAYQVDIGLVLGSARQGAFRWKQGAQQGILEPLGNIEPMLQGLQHVNHIVNDGQSLWFASAGEGLFRWNFANSQVYQILSETFLLRSNRISALIHAGDWVFIGDDRGGIAGYHLGDQRWYIWDSGRNLEFSSISTLAYRNGQLFYSTLAGGLYQIHWLKYLFALRQKQEQS